MNAGCQRITDLADGFLCFKGQFALSLGLLDLVLKVKARLRLALFLIKDALFFENLLCGQPLTGGIQTLMCLLGLLFKPLDFPCGRNIFVGDWLIRSRFCRLIQDSFTVYIPDSIRFSDFA